MWIELGLPKPGVTVHPLLVTWLNTDHIVRAEFLTEHGKTTATVITTKPGGSDRSSFTGVDADKIRQALELDRSKQSPPTPKKKKIS